MKYHIHKAVVIGAGTMGAAIAAHLANAGVPVTLLDIVPNKLTPEEEKKGLSLERSGSAQPDCPAKAWNGRSNPARPASSPPSRPPWSRWATWRTISVSSARPIGSSR